MSKDKKSRKKNNKKGKGLIKNFLRNLRRTKINPNKINNTNNSIRTLDIVNPEHDLDNINAVMKEIHENRTRIVNNINELPFSDRATKRRQVRATTSNALVTLRSNRREVLKTQRDKKKMKRDKSNKQ
jgi:hypothetical protein